MANDYTFTDNFGLQKYGDKTPADFRDGHNNNMDKIDLQLKNNNDASKNTQNLLTAIGVTDTDSAIALKHNIDNSTECLANLQSNTPDTAAATYNKITSNSDNISTLFAKVENRVSKPDVSNILCIGDSFGDETAKSHGNWVKGLRQALPNATFMNQCVSGSGFVRNFGVKFIQQINNAITANFKADYIIIVGGVNDTDENLTNIKLEFERERTLENFKDDIYVKFETKNIT